MKEQTITSDNQGENGIEEIITPKQLCTALPSIKQMKVTTKNKANIITYGRNYEEICPHCGRKFSDHETIRYRKKG